MAKRPPQKKAQDRLIEKSFCKYANVVQINILDIPKIFKIGQDALEQGADLDTAIQAAIAEFRQN